MTYGKVMAYLFMVFLTSESLSAIFTTPSSVVMKRQKIADLIKKLSNNFRNTFENPNYNMKGNGILIDKKELLLERASSGAIVHLLVLLLLGIVVSSCFLSESLHLCLHMVLLGQMNRTSKHLFIMNNNQISCIGSCSLTKKWSLKTSLAKPYCLYLCMSSEPIFNFPAL